MRPADQDPALAMSEIRRLVEDGEPISLEQASVLLHEHDRLKEDLVQAKMALGVALEDLRTR